MNDAKSAHRRPAPRSGWDGGEARGDAVAQVGAQPRPGRDGVWIVAPSAAVWPRATTTPDRLALAMNSIAPGRSGASVNRTIRPPDASWSSSNSSSRDRGSLGRVSPAIALALREERPLEVDAQDLPGRLRIGLAGRGDRAHAVQHLPGGAVIKVGQSRAVPEPLGRTIATTCSTVRSGLENECPHRPLIWMSQNAGATQSSFGLLSAGPSPGRTAAMIPFRISISIQLDV